MKIDPASIAYDIDSVIADTMRLFLDIAWDVYRINHVRYEDLTTYDLTECLGLDEAIVTEIVDRIQDGRYTATLQPITGAPEVLEKAGRYHQPLLFVTARHHPGPINDWLHDTLTLDSSAIEIVTTGSYDGKTSVLLERGVGYFIEDRLETCHTLNAAGITPILFKQPWNRRPHDFIEVDSWDEIEKMMDFP